MTKPAIQNSERELGELSDIAAFDALLNVNGAQVIDVGCGDGSFALLLAERGARVLGIEPGRERPESKPVAGGGALRIVPGQAQSLPVADGSADVVVFKYSLHHVPVAAMATAVEEAIRVLKPEGSLYVAEPLPEGPFHDVIHSFHDESEVQAAAREVLRTTATPRFAREQIFRYANRYQYRDFADFVADMTSKAYNHYSRADVENDRVRQAFEAHADSTGYPLAHPVRINLFSSLKNP